jgi:hypothetical protein
MVNIQCVKTVKTHIVKYFVVHASHLVVLVQVGVAVLNSISMVYYGVVKSGI